MPTHTDFMQQAIRAARSNARAPFGAVLVDVDQETVAADGVNRVDDSPIWHGEMVVLERYATSRQDRWHRLRLYSTAEPCSMCLAAILWAGVPEVVYGTSIATLRELGWQQFSLSSDELLAGTPFANCHITGGVLADECDALFREAKG